MPGRLSSTASLAVVDDRTIWPGRRDFLFAMAADAIQWSNESIVVGDRDGSKVRLEDGPIDSGISRAIPEDPGPPSLETQASQGHRFVRRWR
jgi:hypothetical protein